MTDLPERLRIKASMIELGERIAWGSDSALMREAADSLDAMGTTGLDGTPDERFDTALDSVLSAALEAMREAMRKVMSDSYIAGSNACHRAYANKEGRYRDD